MSGALFEQYKAALRRGHVAVLGGELVAALDAYREAARLVPDRALPHASLGTVLYRMGRPADAEAAFETALRLAPGDEATLAAWATARGDALPAPDATTPEPTAPEEPEPEAPAPEPTTPAAMAPEAMPSTEPPGGWPAIDLPSPAPQPIAADLDPEALLADAAARQGAGDAAGARDRMLAAVAVHRAAGRPDAALDACFGLLAIAPGDPAVHLAIAGLQLDRGWQSLAADKIALLLRLTALTGDTQAAADAHALAAERLRDEPAEAGAAGR